MGGIWKPEQNKYRVVMDATGSQLNGASVPLTCVYWHSAQVAYLSSVFGLGQIRDHFGVWAFSQRVCGRSAITNPELYRTRDSLAILSKQGKLSKPADL
jgi:hypothetical protein